MDGWKNCPDFLPLADVMCVFISLSTVGETGSYRSGLPQHHLQQPYGTLSQMIIKSIQFLPPWSLLVVRDDLICSHVLQSILARMFLLRQCWAANHEEYRNKHWTLITRPFHTVSWGWFLCVIASSRSLSRSWHTKDHHPTWILEDIKLTKLQKRYYRNIQFEMITLFLWVSRQYSINSAWSIWWG